MNERPAMQAADRTRTEAGNRRKAVERLVLDLIVSIEDGAPPATAFRIFADRAHQEIPGHIVRQHRDRLKPRVRAVPDGRCTCDGCVGA